MGTQLALPQRGTVPQFSAHFYCGQKAGCIKVSLGMEVGLSPEDFVFDGDPAPTHPQKGGGAPPNFQPMSIAVKRLDGSGSHLVLDGDPRHTVLHGDPAPPFRG